ncbi:MAG TPA: hypothetical protein VNZ02_17300 [Steroidobacteraceae bacterium]|jgi:hypothetical protein|nr:hypothetical protein [Steroidobacteraceae bacterium]
MLPPESTSCSGSGGAAGAAGETTARPAESSGFAMAHCRDWLQWAAAQVEACVASDKLAMNELLAALSVLMGSARSATAASHQAADGKLSAVIMAVQAHDRVMQSLVHVTESLRALQGQLGDARHADSADAWRLLREKQFMSFSMPEERQLFARLVAGEEEVRGNAGGMGAGSVELFASNDGRFGS